MSEEQLSALLAKLKDDAVLQEKLKDAADLDAAVAIAKDAGFDVSKEDWLSYQAKQMLELSDRELEEVAGGKDTTAMADQCGNLERPDTTRCGTVKVGCTFDGSTCV
jgi:predicted ribosomally synthesized peptide with nif11-like leader